jgi:gliding motility-associated-like protein
MQPHFRIILSLKIETTPVMKPRYYLLLLLLFAATKSSGQCFTYTVDACIDYDDWLHISGDSLWWENFGGSPPNTHSGCSAAATVNGVAWTPWNSVYILPNSTQNCTMVATVLGCSNICNVVQEPTAANGWQGIYDFNDEGPSGAHPYSIQFAFYCPVVTTSPDTTVCAGTNASLRATGGVTYSWGPTAGLSCSTCANTTATPTVTTVYTVTATDAYNCSGTASITVTVPTAISITPTTVPDNCFGLSDGSATAAYTGGSGAVTYAWNNAITTATDPNLASGNYSVTLTDAMGCTASATATVTQPNLLTASATGTDVTCNAGSDGTITLTVNGGTTPYTFAWNDGNTNQNRTGIAAGNYSVTVTDHNLCSATATYTVNQPTALYISQSDTEVSCNGQSTGAIAITDSGGSPPYTYLWSDAATTQSRSGLAAGNYSITLTDSHSCTISASATITQPPLLTVSATTVSEFCFGQSIGSIQLQPGGGTTPYAFLWSDANTSQNRSALSAGIYDVTVTDALSCTVSINDTITQPDSINLSATQINDSCHAGANGSINLTMSGGSTPYSFLWSDGNTNQNRTGLPAADYIVTVTDANTCSVDKSIVISQPSALWAATSHTDILCWGGHDGTITLSDSGGTPPYTWLWADGPSSQNRNALATGTYTVTVTDKLLCTATSTATIIQPDSIAITAVVVEPLCPSVDFSGWIAITVTGGTFPYQYQWSTGANSPTTTGLTIGNFSVLVTDTHACTDNAAYTLAYLYDYTIQANPSVTINLGGSAVLGYTLTGNAGNYVNIWSPSVGLSCVDCPGPIAVPVRTTLYNITVQNDSGCSVSDTMTVYVIPEYNIFIPNAFTPNNSGNNDVFRIFGNTQSLTYLAVSIYDRLGERVFQSNDINFQWDGTFKGAKAPEGVYVYEMKLVFIDDHSEKLRKGTITLLR